MKKLITILFALYLTLNHYCNAQQQTACINVPDDNFVNHPESCAHFYYCESQRAHPGQCPDGFQFDPITQVCDFPDHVDCKECSPFGIQNLPINGSCTIFMACQQGIPQIQTCSAGLYFDPTIGTCNFPHLVNCDSPPTEFPPPITTPPSDQPPTTDPNEPVPTTDPSQPTPPHGDFKPDCSGSQIFHAHPTDCSRFFICVSGNPLPGQCQDGQQWNQLVNNCDNPLNTICFQAPPPPPPTPTVPPFFVPLVEDPIEMDH